MNSDLVAEFGCNLIMHALGVHKVGSVFGGNKIRVLASLPFLAACKLRTCSKFKFKRIMLGATKVPMNAMTEQY